MKRAIAAAVVVSIAAAAAAWFLWRRTPSVAPPPQASTAAAPARSAAAAPAAPAVQLALQVDGGEEASVPAGAPLLLTVTLSGRAAGESVEQLRIEGGGGETLAWRAERLGQPETMALEGGESLLRVEFGVSPEDAARIPVGTQAIRAALPASAGAAPIVSNNVPITVAAAEGADARRRQAELTARFHLRRGRYQEAERTLLPLVETDGADAAIFMLFGDALAGLNRDAEALAAYHEALALVPDHDEPPDALLSRIQHAGERIK